MRRAKNLQSSFRVYRCLVRECLAEGLARPRLASPRPAGSDSASGETSGRTAQANDDGLLCKGTGLDPGPSHVHGGNLFCERRAHPIEIHIAHNCAYVACVDGPNQRGQFIQRPSDVADPDQADNNEGNYCLAQLIVLQEMPGRNTNPYVSNGPSPKPN